MIDYYEICDERIMVCQYKTLEAFENGKRMERIHGWVPLATVIEDVEDGPFTVRYKYDPGTSIKI